MLQDLLQFDTDLLLKINGNHTDFFDHFFWIISNQASWVLIGLTLLYILFQNRNTTGLYIFVGIVLTIVLSDQISSSVLKPIFARLRPTHEPSLNDLIHLVNNYRGGKFGFVSSHAANSFGIALFLSLIFRKPIFVGSIFLWAGLNAYSRMYLGVHYPGDILGGIVVGIISAYLSYFLLKRILIKKGYGDKNGYINVINPEKHNNYLSIAIALTLLFISALYMFN